MLDKINRKIAYESITDPDLKKPVKINNDLLVKYLGKPIFRDDDIIKAKVTYLNSLKELEDNPQSILSMYVGMEYLNSHDMDMRINNINKVSKSDVVALANKIHIDTIYLLEGGEKIEKA